MLFRSKQGLVPSLQPKDVVIPKSADKRVKKVVGGEESRQGAAVGVMTTLPQGWMLGESLVAGHFYPARQNPSEGLLARTGFLRWNFLVAPLRGGRRLRRQRKDFPDLQHPRNGLRLRAESQPQGALVAVHPPGQVNHQ